MVKIVMGSGLPEKFTPEQLKYMKKHTKDDTILLVRSVVDSLRANGSQWKNVFDEAQALLNRQGHELKSGHAVKRLYFAKQKQAHSRK